MPEGDRFRYHAYNYGWQRVYQGRYDKHEPIDPSGQWFIAHMADRAEEFFRKKTGQSAARYRSPPMPQDETLVRPNWRQLWVCDLTKAERALLSGSVDEIMRRFRAESPRKAEQAQAQINAMLGVEPAKEIPPP